MSLKEQTLRSMARLLVVILLISLSQFGDSVWSAILRLNITVIVEKFDFLIVGAGFAGAVLAECIASQLGKICLIVEKRHHIGGNPYDHHDASGILVHDYGPHYFRTNSQRMAGYLSQFTEWRSVSLQNLILGRWPLLHFPISGAAKRWLHVNAPEGILMTANREHLNDYAPTIPYFETAFRGTYQ